LYQIRQSIDLERLCDLEVDVPNLAQTLERIALEAGSPGSGRHKEFIAKIPNTAATVKLTKLFKHRSIDPPRIYPKEKYIDGDTPKRQKVAIADLVPTQDEVHGNTVHRYLNKAPTKHIEVKDIGRGKYAIVDGHHSTVAEILKGKTHIDVDVYPKD